MSQFQSNKPKAVWTQANEHFRVSDKGCISIADGAPYEGKGVPYLTVEMVEYFNANRESLNEALSLAKGKAQEVGLNKETGKLVAILQATGMDEATAIEQAVVILKKRIKTA